MYGLYDNDGIFRFMGGDMDACEAYAGLFELSLDSCSVIPMPSPSAQVVRKRRSRPQAKRSS